MKKTVADLIEILRGLPQDALVVSDAGGDCIGYSDVVSDHATVSWKTGEILLSLADGSSSYHGAYDEWEDVLKSARKAAPASATDDEAIQLLAETAAQELAKAEEEALCIVKLPTGYNPDRWTIERYREREFRLSQRRSCASAVLFVPSFCGSPGSGTRMRQDQGRDALKVFSDVPAAWPESSALASNNLGPS